MSLFSFHSATSLTRTSTFSLSLSFIRSLIHCNHLEKFTHSVLRCDTEDSLPISDSPGAEGISSANRRRHMARDNIDHPVETSANAKIQRIFQSDINIDENKFESH